MCWTSRQHDGAKAIMLFGDRVDKSILVPLDISKALIHEGFVVDSLIALGDRVGVTIVS